MEWPKLKNIVLIILAITNLCLLVFVAQRELRDSQLQQQSRAEAIRFLEERGVAVTEEQVPRTMDLQPLTAARDLAREAELAAALLGQAAKEDRGAGVYRYSGVSGFIQFHSDGAFSAEFEPGLLLGKDLAEECGAVLEKLDFQGELVEQSAGDLVFRQLWKGYPLFTQQVTLEVEEGRLTAMTSGRRLVGEPEADSNRQSVTVVTALIDFWNELNALGDVCSRIDSIVPGYVSVAALSGTMTLTPVWQITTDTGAYRLDLVTGELSRLT